MRIGQLNLKHCFLARINRGKLYRLSPQLPAGGRPAFFRPGLARRLTKEPNENDDLLSPFGADIFHRTLKGIDPTLGSEDDEIIIRSRDQVWQQADRQDE